MEEEEGEEIKRRPVQGSKCSLRDKRPAVVWILASAAREFGAHSVGMVLAVGTVDHRETNSKNLLLWVEQVDPLW